MQELIIIGAGPAGLYAGFIAGLRHIQAIVLESLPFAGGQLSTIYPEKPVYDIPGFSSILASDFIQHLKQQHQPFQQEVPIYYQKKVVTIQSQGDHYNVTTQDGTEYQALTILIATGSGAMKPQTVPPSLLDEGVVLNYTIEDVNALRKQHITILGGGDSAFDWANMLALRGHQVALIHHRKEFRAFDHSITSFQTKGTMYAPYTILKVSKSNVGYRLAIEQTETKQTQIIETDLILVCYGYQPTPQGYETWGLSSEKGLLAVNRILQTNLDRVFAIGNVVTYEGKSHTIASALGEVTHAMEKIHNILRPKQRMVYSSALKLPNRN
jgi:ferredoxin/flavodoxin---NADP+ reductase